MTKNANIEFIDNKAAQKAPEKFMSVQVDVARVLKSWKTSLFSYEWLDGEGKIKPFQDLDAPQTDKLRAAQSKMTSGEKLEKPILGIGILDNVEIGAGHAEFIIAALQEYKAIPAHIPKSNESDFKDFIADVS